MHMIYTVIFSLKSLLRGVKSPRLKWDHPMSGVKLVYMLKESLCSLYRGIRQKQINFRCRFLVQLKVTLKSNFFETSKAIPVSI